MAGPDYSTPFSRLKERLERVEDEEEREEIAEDLGVLPPHRYLGLPRFFSRVPTAAWAILGLALGLWFGNIFPALAPLGDGVKAAFGGIASAVPVIIFFTLTPALVTMYRTASAGKFALYTSVGYLLTTVFAGLFALLMALAFFPDVTTGFGAKGIGDSIRNVAGRTAVLAYTSPPFKAIWASIAVSTLLYFGGGLKHPVTRNPVRRMLRTMNDIYDLVGVHGVAFLGRVIKVLMPFILFALGVFLVASVDSTIAQLRDEVGQLEEPPWSALEAYFRSVAYVAAVTLLWLVLVTFALTQYIRYPVKRVFVDYIGVVYPFAWATASSSATIPINLEAARKGLGVRGSVRDFIIPLGATVNLDGTMMGAVVLTVIAGKMVGYTPSVLDLLVALLPLAFITVGVPGVPGGLSFVAGPILADLLPLPTGTETLFTGIFIVLGLGLTDQFRTAVNTCDNGLLALLLDKWWPERFEPGAEPNPYLVLREPHLVTAGSPVPPATATGDTSVLAEPGRSSKRQGTRRTSPKRKSATRES